MSLSANFPTIRPSLLLDFANTQTLDPRITFTRSTTATYYDGVTTAMAEQNLFKYSNDVTAGSYWAGQYIASYTATTAPDGTSTAVSVLASAGTSISPYFAYDNAATVLVSGGVYTYSFYAKAGTHSLIQFTANAMTTTYVNYDLSSGVLGNTGNATGTITSVGSGWYRCTATYTTAATASTPFVAFIASSTAGRRTVFNPTGTETLLFWGAQLEQRSSVTAYTATTTQPITNYIPVLQTAAANVARFDHNPTTGEALGLLIEEQRTNTMVYSQQLSQWTNLYSSDEDNVIIAPNGTLTGGKITCTSDGSYYLYRGSTVSGAGTWTISAYMKAASSNIGGLYVTGGSNLVATFNLSTGTVVSVAGTSASATITPVGNGWYRCSATTVTTSSGNSGFYVPNSAVVGDSVYFWGAQVEAGSFATSYIPTVASQVTRSADSASMTGTNFSSWYSAGEGTLYVEAALYALPTQDTTFFRMYSSANEDIQIYYSTPGYTRLYIQDNASTVVNIVSSSSTVQANTFLKQAAAFKTNDAAFSVNGALIGTDSVFTMPDANTMYVGSRAMYVRKATYYPLRVTNAQLQALTS